MLFRKSKAKKVIPLTVNVPYGYVKDPNDPHHWIIDPEAALVVKNIFTMCMEAVGPSQIANQTASGSGAYSHRLQEAAGP